MEDERNLQWPLRADDLRHFRTYLTNALLAAGQLGRRHMRSAAGQLGRRHMRSADARRLHAHLSTALDHLVTRLRQVEQRGREGDAP